MRRSLFFKLLGAFALVILALAVIVAVLVNRATARQFRLYSDRNGQLWAAQLAPQLAGYYAQQGGWQGSEAVLRGPGTMGPGMMGSGRMMGPGMMGSGVAGASDIWAMMGLRAVLADASGRVISDSADLLTGQTLPLVELTTGAPIRVNGQIVGTVLVTSSAMPIAESSAGAFLKEVNRSILMAVLAAAVIALALGALLFFQLTAPIRRLTAAAHAISAGDLSQRVVVHSGDELGDLAGAFNTMAENLAAAEGQRRQMAADVAHELRTPLSVIQANVEAMQDGVLPTDAEQLASLHQETLLLSRLVADLRLISLAEAGQLKLERTDVDLSDLLRKAVERMHPAAKAIGITLNTDLPPSGPVLADSDRLNQVIGNLMENALRHTPAGGAVTLQLGLAGPDPAGAPALQAGGKAYLVTVTDTGVGIPPEDLPHVFDRFYRADKSRTRATGGSGLGLPIVRRLVEAHGGRVWADSPVYRTAADGAHGTRVSFTLPIVM
jgi:two-component system OmpR family sensor kinase/two-component system sensor histidine kinase BaeS